MSEETSGTEGALEPSDDPWRRRTWRRLKKGYDLYDTIGTWLERLETWPGYIKQLLALLQANSAATAAGGAVAAGAVAGTVAIVEPAFFPNLIASVTSQEDRVRPAEEAPRLAAPEGALFAAVRDDASAQWGDLRRADATSAAPEHHAALTALRAATPAREDASARHAAAARPIEPTLSRATVAARAPARLDASLRRERQIVQTLRWGEAVVFPVEGLDRAGRRAGFDVAVLPERYAWAHASSARLSRDDDPLSDQALRETIFTDAFRAGLRGGEALIAVGVASQEGTRSIQIARAGRRARTAAAWLARYVDATTPLYLLNLGQYEGSCAAEAQDGASWQRPVLFIAVRSAEPEVDLETAPITAISGKANLPDKTCYTTFELRRAE